MKKYILSIFIGASLLTSCDMNELPIGQISDESAVESVKDATSYRNGIYNEIRGITAGAYASYPEIQADNFIGTLVNGNRIGVISVGNLNSSDKDLESFWADGYSCIASVNYFLPHLETLINKENISDEDKFTLMRFRGESHWARAYYYYFLADHYCNSYTIGNPDAENSGLPIVTDYLPTGDYTLYQGRSTLTEVFALIEKDLTQSFNDLDAYEKSGLEGATSNMAPNAPYLSTYAVMALQARVALLKGDYATAISKAESVIAGPFSLANTDNYFDIWDIDSSDELIFVPYGNNAQSGAVPSTGSAWLGNTSGVVDYVASSAALALYDEIDDIRYEAFFTPAAVSLNGNNYAVPSFIKFPGNPEFNTSSNNAFKNKPKPFRLSETYLILAEAAAMSNQPEKANSALNELRRNRIYEYQDQNYNGQTLINQIREERTKEFIGEGFRISDLRRWGIGFTRSYDYTGIYEDVPETLTPASRDTEYVAGDYRYVYPIPTNEMETNPYLKGHQNPGYTN